MPEGTSNQLLRDTMVRRQIYLQRYSATLSRDITALLDDTEKQVRDTIERRLAALEGKDFSATTNSRLNVLANALEKLRRDAFNGANEMWDDHMQALAVAEAEFLDSAIKDVSPVVLDTTMPDPVHLGSIVSTQPMQGHLLEDWASGLASKDVDRMMASVRTGIAQGSTTDEIVRGILGSASMDGADGILEMTRKDIRSITNTAVQTVAGEARQAYAEANSDIIPQEQYVSALDAHTTIECAALDGTLFDVGEGEQPPIHWNALPGDSIIFSKTAITAVAKHLYVGPLTVIRTAGGREVACTPHHKVLTDRGIVEARFVDQTYRMVCDLSGEGPMGIDPKYKQAPSTIQDVFSSLSETPGWSISHMPVAPEYLDGHVVDGKVYVVAPNGSLGTQAKTPLLQYILEFLFQDGKRNALISSRFGKQSTLCSRPTSDAGIGCPCHCFSFGVGPGCPDFEISLARFFSFAFALPSNVRSLGSGTQNVFSSKRFINDKGRVAKFFGKLFCAFSRCIPSKYCLWDSQLPGVAPPRRSDACRLFLCAKYSPLTKEGVYGCYGTPLLFGQLLGTDPNKILLDDVVWIGERMFRGHVYCPSTEDGVYQTVGGVSMPNCRSVRVPVIDGAAIGDRPATSAFEDDLAGLDKEERAARVSELTGRVPGTTTYQSFLGRQTNAFQEEVLGTQRAALFRDGGLTLDRFTDRKNQPYTLDQLRAREPEAFQRIRSK